MKESYFFLFIFSLSIFCISQIATATKVKSIDFARRFAYLYSFLNTNNTLTDFSAICLPIFNFKPQPKFPIQNTNTGIFYGLNI